VKSELSYLNQSKPLFLTSYQVFHAREQTRERTFGIACYFGFAPLLWLFGIPKRRNGFLQYHFRHSLAVSLLAFFFIFSTLVATLLAYAYDIFWGADTYATHLPVLFFDYMGNIIACFGIVAWLILFIGAWRGWTPHLPLVSSLAWRDGWVNFSLGWTALTQVIIILLAFMAVRGNALVAKPKPSPEAYILYTTGGYIQTERLWASYTPPRWTISLFFYPIVSEAVSRWGDGSVVVEPLSDATFKNAIRNGKFVFVASHGGMEPGGFSYAFDPYQGFLPSDLRLGDAGSQLRYVYFAACYAGYLESEWKQLLAPADVVTYARISYVEEHFVWVWTKGAEVIRSME
jgi:hypothetical protein